jgi:hypothetical protein
MIGRWWLIGLAIFAVFMMAMNNAARAHGPAQWIQDGHYKNQVGELCCGERDCGFFKSGTVEHVEGGYQVDAAKLDANRPTHSSHHFFWPARG